MEFYTFLQFAIPTAISIFALLNAISAKSKATESSKRAYDLQERMEIYQFFPIIEADIISEENKLKVVLTNQSDINAAPLCKINYVLRISSSGTYSIDAAGKFEVKNILPQTIKEEVNDEVNSYVEDGIAFLKKARPEDTHFVFRIFITYSSSHPEARILKKEVVKYFELVNGQLTEK